MNKSTKMALLGSVLAAGVSAQAAVPTEVSAAVASSVIDILAVVAIGGAAFITIAGGGVIWNVAAKFIKRLGGKA